MKTGMGTPAIPLSRHVHRTARKYPALLWLLSFLFALRVLGQALQRWLPQPFLPPFNAFQGSGLPYWLLLSAQILILGLMIHTSRGVQTGSLIARHRTSIVWACIGWLYLTGSLARIAIGLALPDAHAWFSSWIPAFFHIVLAGFVLTLAYYHRHQPEIGI
jgi:hypothetical protein